MLNYIEFEAAIPLFRESDQHLELISKESALKSGLYILTDFTLSKNYDVGGCTIYKSEQKFLDSNTFSNLSKIELPKWLTLHKNEEYASACYGLVLSSIISLATERSVKFYRDFYKIGGVDSVALHHPLQSTGPGAIDRLNEETVDALMMRVKKIYEISKNLKYADYLSLMRSCRLFQLAHHSKYVDHNLSYSLMISAIESNATKAIEIKEIKEGWTDIKKKIKKVADEAELEQEFRDVLYDKLNNHYSGLRFRKFIIDYAPIESLDLESRYDRMGLLNEEKKALEPMEMKVDSPNYFIHFYRKHPDFLAIFKKETGTDFTDLLKNSYTYRSEFYHDGKALQFNSPQNYDRYTKTIFTKDNQPIMILTYNLLAQIARISTFNLYKKYR